MELEFAGKLFAALAVIAAILAALQVAARSGMRARCAAGCGNGRLVTVLETTVLPNGSSLHALKIGERYIVVGRSGSSVSMLCDLPPMTVEAWVAARTAPSVQRLWPRQFTFRWRRRRNG